MILKKFASQLTSCLLPVLFTTFLSAQILPRQLSTVDTKVVYEALNALEQLPSSSVSAADLAIIDAALTQEDTPYRGRFFLLAGWLGRTDALYAVPQTYRHSLSNKNDYDMAMLRAGVPSYLARLQSLIPTLTVDDNFVYRLGPALLYTKRREVIDFFLAEILEDKRNCKVAEAHSEGRINCAYRLLEMIAPIIQDFPLKLRASGDLATDDYPSALEIAREWIRNHRNDYLIITETF
jgi:hypothetical protein